MKVVAVYNIKGGVGKTATSVNVAYEAARAGYRTLIWDLDPQGAASYYFRVKPKVKGGGRALIRLKRTLDTVLKATDFENLDLVPADFSYRHLDLQLAETRKPARLLRKLIKQVRDEYDWVFLDCAPSISLVSESVFEAADGLLIPTIPTTLSLRTYAQLLGYLEEARLTGVGRMPFFSMADRRKRLHLEVMRTQPRTHPEFLRADIPYASQVEQMGVHRQPVGAYAPRSEIATAYHHLWREVQTRCASRAAS